MESKELFNVILKVISDWKVIVTTVAMLFVMNFVRFICNYQKRPSASKQKKSKSTENKTPASESQTSAPEENSQNLS